MFTYEEKKIVDTLRRIDTRGKVAFAAACASRLYPAYKAYTSENGYGQSDFDLLLQRIWRFTVRDGQLENKIEERDLAQIPDDDQGGYDLSFLASDATASLIYASWAAIDDSEQAAAWAARRAYEAFDWVAQRRPTMPQDRFDEDALIADPLVQAELGEQFRDLEDLRQHGGGSDYVAMQTRAILGRANMEAALTVVISARG